MIFSPLKWSGTQTILTQSCTNLMAVHFTDRTNTVEVPGSGGSTISPMLGRQLPGGGGGANIQIW